MTNNEEPAHWFESTMFAKEGHIWIQQDQGLECILQFLWDI